MLPNASGFTTSFDLTKWCPLLVIKYENYARINIALAYYIKSDCLIPCIKDDFVESMTYMH